VRDLFATVEAAAKTAMTTRRLAHSTDTSTRARQRQRFDSDAAWTQLAPAVQLGGIARDTGYKTAI
jgi:hypothetical protein